jgi:hypothetical protein
LTRRVGRNKFALSAEDQAATKRLLMKKSRNRFVLVFVVTALAVGLVAANPSVAQASNWYNYYTAPSGGTPPAVWHSISTALDYNGARTETYQEPGATAYVTVTGIGSANGPQTVTVTFAYRQVDAKCKWFWYGHSNKGPLICDLRY